MYDAVPAVEHPDVVAHLRVLPVVRRKQRVQRSPASQVAPAEIRRQHIDTLRLLHYRIVDGNLLTGREEPFQFLRFLLRVQARSQFVHHPRYLRCVHSQGSRNRVYVPYKDTRVPQVVPCSQVLPRHFQVRLLTERIHPVYFASLQFLARADVAVSRFRSGRADSQSHDAVRMFRKVQGLPDVSSELLRINHQGVRRRHHDVRLRVLLPDFPAGVGDAGSRVPGLRFRQDVLFRDVRKLFPYDVLVGFRGHHPEVLGRTDTAEAVYRKLNQRFAHPHHVDKLFRVSGGTHGPEPAADSARHDHDVMMLHHVSLFRSSLIDSVKGIGFQNFSSSSRA